MFNKYYQDELFQLRERAAEFSGTHPALAPMLDGTSADPDVERVLEGVAFLTGMLREKIDDEFPEIIQEMIRHLWPHYLRPFPATTLIQFSATELLQQATPIPAGIQLDSIPVDGTSCRFRSVYDVDMLPVTIQDLMFYEKDGLTPNLKISLSLNQLNMKSLKMDSLCFHLGGTYQDAAYLYLLLKEHVTQIRLRSEQADLDLLLSPDDLRGVGFTMQEGLIPYPSHFFPGYRLIQEYFVMPEKFLFIELTGLNRWTSRGNGDSFDIEFEFDSLPDGIPTLIDESIMLHVTPAVNIFSHDADPVYADHRKSDYPVIPTTDAQDHYQIYSLDRVTGFSQGASREREYKPFHRFDTHSDTSPVYNEHIRMSQSDDIMDLFISLSYKDRIPETETLSMDITCTNGFLTDHLEKGDIHIPSETTPEFIEFQNIRKPTTCVLPALNNNSLWKLVSMFSLNYMSLFDVENLKCLLSLYVFEESRDKICVSANKKRIEGLQDIQVSDTDAFVSGIMMRGREVRMKLRSDHFSGIGDMYLFGTMLHHFISLFSSLNTFTRVVVDDVLTGESYTWPEII